MENPYLIVYYRLFAILKINTRSKGCGLDNICYLQAAVIAISSRYKNHEVAVFDIPAWIELHNKEMISLISPVN